MEQDIQKYSDIAVAYATEAGLKILAAIVFWIVGRWLIGLAGWMLQRSPRPASPRRCPHS